MADVEHLIRLFMYASTQCGESTMQTESLRFPSYEIKAAGLNREHEGLVSM